MTWEQIFEDYIEGKVGLNKSVVDYLKDNYNVPLPKHKKFTIDKNKHAVVYNGIETKLQKKTFQVLSYLYDNMDKIVTRDEIYANVWEGMIVEERTIDVHVRKIRKNIPEIPLHTEKKLGLIWKEN
jgi:DNA-binding response OmpR family regulator